MEPNPVSPKDVDLNLSVLHDRRILEKTKKNKKTTATKKKKTETGP